MIAPGMQPRMKDPPGRPPPPPRPAPPWMAGAAIGLVLFSMASGAIALGAGWALMGPRKDR
ncbi:MAG: hypothetical protein P4L71_01725 [Acetobacteraceae bacterium]|nr:hypothetical protein [Acetobacteraceae bacterium]